MVYIPVNYQEEVEEEKVILPLEVLYIDGVRSDVLRKNVGIRAIYVENLLLIAQEAKETSNWYKSLTASLKMTKHFDIKIRRPDKHHWEILSKYVPQINRIMKKVGVNGLITARKSFWENLEADRESAYCYNFKLGERIKVNKSAMYFSLFVVDLDD